LKDALIAIGISEDMRDMWLPVVVEDDEAGFLLAPDKAVRQGAG